MCLVCHFVFRWSFKTTIVALLAAIPPFASIWFERKAVRDGLLTRARTGHRLLSTYTWRRPWDLGKPGAPCRAATADLRGTTSSGGASRAVWS